MARKTTPQKTVLTDIPTIEELVYLGHTVYAGSTAYRVIRDSNGQYLIKCDINQHCVGLAGKSGLNMTPVFILDYDQQVELATYIMPDGFKFKEQPDGSISDGDMHWFSVKQFATAMRENDIPIGMEIPDTVSMYPGQYWLVPMDDMPDGCYWVQPWFVAEHDFTVSDNFGIMVPFSELKHIDEIYYGAANGYAGDFPTPNEVGKLLNKGAC